MTSGRFRITWRHPHSSRNEYKTQGISFKHNVYNLSFIAYQSSLILKCIKNPNARLYYFSQILILRDQRCFCKCRQAASAYRLAHHMLIYRSMSPMYYFNVPLSSFFNPDLHNLAMTNYIHIRKNFAEHVFCILPALKLLVFSTAI